MAEPGIFTLTGLFAGAIGTLMTGPIGQVEIPDKSFPGAFSAPAGYRMELEDASGASLGGYRAPGPVRVDLALIPQNFLGAVMAAEDKRFVEHGGIDPFGTLLALKDTVSGDMRGGSGIAQQMVKNTVVGNGITLDRKIAEALIATRAYHNLGASEVLRLYLENAWFGRGQTGAARAPEAWFGKSWAETSLAEAAYLAALLKGPAAFDASRHPDRAKERRDWIIGQMARNGWITQEEAETAKAEPLVITPYDPKPEEADPWAQSAALWQMQRDQVDQVGSDLKAGLTLDGRWQALAQNALSDRIGKIGGYIPLAHLSVQSLGDISDASALREAERRSLRQNLSKALPSGSSFEPALLISRGEAGWNALILDRREGLVRKVIPNEAFQRDAKPVAGDVLAVETQEDGVFVHSQPAAQGAIVILDPRTGAILASVGGVETEISTFDRTRARRQPGSSAKTFLWLAALDMGIRYDTEVADIERTYVLPDGVTWTPRNYDGSQSGLVPLYKAYEHSSNLVAASLADLVGIEPMAQMAENAGAWAPGTMRRHPSSALGASETTLLDLTAGYAAIINDAYPRSPYVIETLTAEDGTLRIDAPAGLSPVSVDARPGPIASSQAMNDMISMMWGVTHRGTAARAFSGHPVALAGKTGTSQDYRDAWFLGVTPHLAIGVWLGRDDNKPLPGESTGGLLAAPIAAEILRAAFDAGMIDSEGLRDGALTSSVTWPPALLSSGAWAPSIDMFPRDHDFGGAPSPSASGQPAEDIPISGGGFWGVVADTRSDAEFARDANRNSDLLPPPEN